MEDKKIYGVLFGEINLLAEEHLDTIVNTLDEENAKFLMTMAVKYAFHKGIYSIGESEVISKCIRLLHKEKPTN